MKLKYECRAETELGSDNIVDKILIELKKQHYIITEEKNNVIFFKDDSYEFRLKGDIIKKVDYGKLEVNQSSDDGTQIILTYYVSINVELLLTIASILIGFITGIYWVPLIVLPFMIQLVVRINNLKYVAKELLIEFAGKKTYPG